MARRGIELTGIPSLLSQVRTKSERAANAVERTALRAGGQIMADDMASRVDKSDRNSPHMSENITVSNVRRKDGVKYVLVGPNRRVSFRAHFNEFGTSKMQAKPFIEPAYLAKRDDVLREIAKTLREGLRN